MLRVAKMALSFDLRLIVQNDCSVLKNVFEIRRSQFFFDAGLC
jgi:hypothetical protein